MFVHLYPCTLQLPVYSSHEGKDKNSASPAQKDPTAEATANRFIDSC